jgi:hypothetical protein
MILAVPSLVVAALALSATLYAADKADKRAGQTSQDEMMAAYMKLASPGEFHGYLKPLAGTGRPRSSPMRKKDQMSISEGACQSSWVMDGRYLKEECTGNFEGMPFNGMGFTGYDNATKKYVSSWVDTMGTGILNSTGTIDGSHKTLTFLSSAPDPMTGKTMKIRMVIKIVDENRHVFSFYGTREGKEALQMEITYTRK